MDAACTVHACKARQTPTCTYMTMRPKLSRQVTALESSGAEFDRSKPRARLGGDSAPESSSSLHGEVRDSSQVRELGELVSFRYARVEQLDARWLCSSVLNAAEKNRQSLSFESCTDRAVSLR